MAHDTDTPTENSEHIHTERIPNAFVCDLLENAPAIGGFDITHFHSSEQFEMLLDRFDLDYAGFREEPQDYTWCNDDGLFLTTYANPLTGYSARHDREFGDGYANHIMLGGPEIDAVRLYQAIRAHANTKNCDGVVVPEYDERILVPE